MSTTPCGDQTQLSSGRISRGILRYLRSMMSTSHSTGGFLGVLGVGGAPPPPAGGEVRPPLVPVGRRAGRGPRVPGQPLPRDGDLDRPRPVRVGRVVDRAVDVGGRPQPADVLRV